MNEEIITGQEENQNLYSLRDFIEKNQKMIAVVGVFVALGLFWKNINTADGTPYISYLCFLITIPLLLEIRKDAGLTKQSWNLKFFVEIFEGIILFTFLNLIFDYPDHLITLMGGVIFAATYFVLITIANNLFQYLKNNKYKKALAFEKNLIKTNLLLEERNKIIIIENAKIQRFYSFINFLDVIAFIIIFSISVAGLHYYKIYIHPTFDLILEKKVEPEVTIPDTNVNK